MSHTVQVRNIQCTDQAALKAACGHLGLKLAERGRHKLYQSYVEGVAVSLPGWNYPVVIDTQTGEAKYDNFNGSWGAQEELDKLIQRYAVEATLLQAQMQGFNAYEQTLDDGAIKLTLEDLATTA